MDQTGIHVQESCCETVDDTVHKDDLGPQVDTVAILLGHVEGITH